MTLEDGMRWLAQSRKRDAAALRVERAYQRTGKLIGVPASKWQEFPCDICGGPLGPTGHMSLTVMELPFEPWKTAHMSTRCSRCEAFWLTLPRPWQAKPR